MPQLDYRTRTQYRTESTAQRVYNFINAGMWALGAAWIVWLVINTQALSDARADAELRRAQESARENQAFCERWGMRAGTAQHATCLHDLADLRDRVKTQALDDLEGVF